MVIIYMQYILSVYTVLKYSVHFFFQEKGIWLLFIYLYFGAVVVVN